MPPNSRLTLAAIVVLLVAIAGACSRNEPLTATETQATPGASTEMFRPVTDIPIPKDAALDAERSLILTGRDDWTGRVVMVTGVGATEAYAFYRSEMPKFDWTPIMSIQSATSVLTFTRQGRAATVQIERRTLGGSVVSVTVARSQETGSAGQVPVHSSPVDIAPAGRAN